jgi:hypothetical protein
MLGMRAALTHDHHGQCSYRVYSFANMRPNTGHSSCVPQQCKVCMLRCLPVLLRTRRSLVAMRTSQTVVTITDHLCQLSAAFVQGLRQVGSRQPSQIQCDTISPVAIRHRCSPHCVARIKAFSNLPQVVAFDYSNTPTACHIACTLGIYAAGPLFCRLSTTRNQGQGLPVHVSKGCPRARLGYTV